LPLLHSTDDNLLGLHVYPARCERTKIALLRLRKRVGFFATISEDSSKPMPLNYQATKVYLAIDQHFQGLTTLNDPGENVIAELVVPKRTIVITNYFYVQCYSCNRPRRSCVRFLEKQGNMSNVAS
jgi:hypothetical protein